MVYRSDSSSTVYLLIGLWLSSRTHLKRSMSLNEGIRSRNSGRDEGGTHGSANKKQSGGRELHGELGFLKKKRRREKFMRSFCMDLHDG